MRTFLAILTVALTVVWVGIGIDIYNGDCESCLPCQLLGILAAGFGALVSSYYVGKKRGW